MEYKPKVFYRGWSEDAINCYNLRCSCSRCELEVYCKLQPKANEYKLTPMKYNVLALYAKFGNPERTKYSDR